MTLWNSHRQEGLGNQCRTGLVSCPTRARPEAVPSITAQPKCSQEGDEARTGARQAGSVQKGGRECPQQHLLQRDKNVAIHAQHKPALSWITSGSPFLKPQPGNAIWLCRPSPRTSVNPLKTADPSECLPLTPSFGTAEAASIPGSRHPLLSSAGSQENDSSSGSQADGLCKMCCLVVCHSPLRVYFQG